MFKYSQFRIESGHTKAVAAGLVHKVQIGRKTFVFKFRWSGVSDLELAPIGCVLSCAERPPRQTPFKIWLFYVA